MNNIRIKAIILGILCVLVIDAASSLLLVFYFAPPQTMTGKSYHDVQQSIAMITSGREYLLSCLLFGTVGIIIGGYVVVRIAGVAHYFNAAIFGVLGILSAVFFARRDPVWFNTSGLALTLPAAMLGAYLGRLHPAKPRPEPSLSEKIRTWQWVTGVFLGLGILGKAILVLVFLAQGKSAAMLFQSLLILLFALPIVGFISQKRWAFPFALFLAVADSLRLIAVSSQGPSLYGGMTSHLIIALLSLKGFLLTKKCAVELHKT